MGTDIHLHVELRVNGTWEHYACPSVQRWYALFGVMAGVRGDAPPIAIPKGVPCNMSIITRMSYEHHGRDAHTASWFNEDEIDKLVAWLKEREQIDRDAGRELPPLGYDLEHEILRGTYLFDSSLTSFKHYHNVEYLPRGCDAVRLVFWFDN